MHRDLLEAARDTGDERAGQRRAAVDVLDGDGDGRLAVIGRAAREHLIHDDAEGIEIGPVVHPRALGLLRRDIVHGAERLARQRALCRGDARDAEVGDLDAAVLQDHDIVRLDIAMDNAAAVGVLERLGDLHGEMQRLAPVEAALLLQILLERDALDQLHDDIVHVAGAGHVVNADDIRVRQHGDGLRLRMEAAAELLIARELILEDLHGDQAVQTVIQCFIYNCHPACPDDLEDLIAVIQQPS